jgi:hypothetical protein
VNLFRMQGNIILASDTSSDWFQGGFAKSNPQEYNTGSRSVRFHITGRPLKITKQDMPVRPGQDSPGHCHAYKFEMFFKTSLITVNHNQENKMKNLINIICPVSERKTDEYATRITAVLTVIITLTALAANSYLVLFLLAADFALRSFTTGIVSLLKILSGQIAGMLKIRNRKFTDAAPKKFAALLGMTFSLLAGLFLAVQLPVAAIVTGSILVFCALLEGVFGYCLGCFVYSMLTASESRQPSKNKLFKTF